MSDAEEDDVKMQAADLVDAIQDFVVALTDQPKDEFFVQRSRDRLTSVVASTLRTLEPRRTEIERLVGL